MSVSVLTVGLLLVAPATINAFDRSKIDIPNKFGIGLTAYNQTQPYEITSLQVTLPGLDPTQLANLEVDNDTTSYHLRLDYWILPFLNVFGLVGEIDGRTTVNLQAIELGLPINLNNIVVDYDGTVYGAGGRTEGGHAARSRCPGDRSRAPPPKRRPSGRLRGRPARRPRHRCRTP